MRAWRQLHGPQGWSHANRPVLARAESWQPPCQAGTFGSYPLRAGRGRMAMSGAGRHLGGELPASEVAAGFSRRGSAATASCLGARRPGSRVSRRSQALPAV